MSSEETKTMNDILELSEKLYAEMCDENVNVHEEIFIHLTELGRLLVNADRASFWKWDKYSHTLWTTAATGIGNGVNRIEIPDDKGLVGKALQDGKVIITNDPYNNPYFNPSVDKKTGYVTKSILTMPVANVNGEFIGAYQVINKLDEDGCFEEARDCRKLSLAAVLCGLALESDVFLEESHTDRLTRLRNRMGFFNDFHKKYDEIAKDPNRDLSLFICDIDKFKSVNDTYGHNIGDEVLKHAASILIQHCNPDDGVYRWGGEEFIMLMADADMEKCRIKAEEVRLFMEQNDCEAKDGDNEYTVHHTMSFGVTSFDPNKTIEENISVADEKLYTAKETGRNRVGS